MSGNGAVMVLVPDSPINLTKDTDLSSQSVISFTWDEAAFNGGKTVLDYRIQYDEGSGSGTLVDLSTVTETQFTSTTTLTPGMTYVFTVEARN